MRRDRATRHHAAGVVAVVALAATLCVGSPRAAGESCGDLPTSVQCGTSADPSQGYFHGVIGVTDQSWVLDVSSHAGTSPGCGDCVWTLALACPESSPNDPGDPAGCVGMNGGFGCPPETTPFRLYLTTEAVTNQLVGVVCLGGQYRVVSITDTGEADVDRYLRNVTPPLLDIAKRPHGPTLAGLTTYFSARPPSDGLGPVGFGGPDVTEAMTLVPEQIRWSWGDGQGSGWLAVDTSAEHSYLTGGRFDGTLTTRWSATYTATFDGETVGPFDATGTIDRSQPFREPVDTSRPGLVSS